MIYLHEIIECLPGKTDEYLDFVEKVYLPYADAHDDKWLLPCGFWKPRTTYGKWSQAVLLYKAHSWERWLNYFGQRGKEANQKYYDEFYTPALKLRSGWYDKVLIRLPFSPEPPTRPQIARPGALFLDHTITVRTDGIVKFIAAMRDIVIPAAAKHGLRLELFARVLGRPSNFHAIWSLAGTAELAKWRSSFDPEALAPSLPSFDAAWEYVLDFEERDLVPTFTSPLGGVDADPTKGSGVVGGLRTSASG